MQNIIRLFMMVCFILVVSVCSSVFAEDGKDVTISGVGTVSIPPNIDVYDLDMNGEKVVNLVVQDNNVFRSTIILGGSFGVTTSTNVDIGYTDLTPLLESFMDSFTISSHGRLLRANHNEVADLGTKKIVSANRVLLIRGMAYDVNVYVIKKEDAVGLVVFMSPDGDRSFWEPLRFRIIATMK